MGTRAPILLVDDHAETVEMLKPLLEAAGHTVVTVRSALEAMAMMKDGLRPAALFTDERMPHASGAEMMRFLRNEDGLREVPVLVLSAQKVAQKGDPLTVVRRKPMDPDSLLRLVDRLVD